MADNSITQLRSEEWRGTRHVVGSDAMPTSTEMRAHDAQYDNPLRGALLHAEGRPVAGIRTADEEIIRGGGQAGPPEHDAWVGPGIAASFRISRIFFPISLKRAFSCIRGQRLAPKASDSAGGLAGLAGIGNLRSPSRPGTREGRATKEGNKR